MKGNNEKLVAEHEAKGKELDLKIADLTSKLDKSANEKTALEKDKENAENKLNEIV